MKSIKIVVFVCAMLLCDSFVFSAPRIIIGGNADGSIPPSPTGICSTSLNVTDKGTLTTSVDASALAVFKAGPTENGSQGIGYALATDGVSNTRLVTFDLSATPLVQTGNVLVNTAGVPDFANQVRGNVYDGIFTVAGTQPSVPCNINSCIHFRTFSGTATVSSTTTGGLTSSGGFSAAFTNNEYWVAYTSGGGSTIGKFTKGYTFVSELAATTNLYGGITSDDTYIYAVINLTGVYNVRRVNRTTSVVTDFALFGGTITQQIYYIGGFLYVGQSGAIQKVRTSDMTIVDTLTLAVGEAPILNGMSFDAANQRLYVVSSAAGATQLRRINLSPFTSEQVFGKGLLPQDAGTGFDFLHQNIYQVTSGANLLVNRYGLCS